MPSRFEGFQPDLPSVDQVNYFGESAVGLIHNLAVDATGGHSGGSIYQIDSGALVEVDVHEFRLTTPNRPDITATFLELDPHSDARYTQTAITLWESSEASLQKRKPVPYEAVECELSIGEEEQLVVIRGLSLQSRIRRMRKVPRDERRIIEKLADPTFTLADYLRFSHILAQCKEANRIDEE